MYIFFACMMTAYQDYSTKNPVCNKNAKNEEKKGIHEYEKRPETGFPG